MKRTRSVTIYAESEDEYLKVNMLIKDFRS